MNQQLLHEKQIAILTDNEFEQQALSQTRQALETMGASVQIVSPQANHVKSANGSKQAVTLSVDATLDQARPANYDALVLPGGLLHADRLRLNNSVGAFVRGFVDTHKPVAAIGHSVWLLVNAGVVQGRMLTSIPSIATDLRNAGADWLDRTVVVDQRLITSRTEDDLPAFTRELVTVLAGHDHTLQETVTTSPHGSFSEGGGKAPLGYDSPVIPSSQLPNEAGHNKDPFDLTP
jgi:protease I